MAYVSSPNNRKPTNTLFRRQAVLPMLVLLLLPTTAQAAAEFQVIPTPGPGWVRAISADGSTVVGESAGEVFRYSAERGYEPVLANGGNPGDPNVALDEPRQIAVATDADGSVVVGTLGINAGRGQPYRWSDTDTVAQLDLLLMDPNLPLAADAGAARDVSADGSVVVGSYSQRMVNDPTADATCRGLACENRNEFMHAFRWEALPDTAPLFTDLAENLPAGESRAVAVAGTAATEQILIQRNTASLPCFGPPIPNCLRQGDALPPMLLDVAGNDRLAGALNDSDIAFALSADGSTVIGTAVPDSAAFRWRADTFFQLLGRRNNNNFFPVFDSHGNFARDLSADGNTIVGAFGVWFEGRTARLKNLLINGLGLQVLGWDFEQYFRDQLFFHPPPAKAAIAPGLHAISDDGTRWAGVALAPRGIAQAIIVQTDGMVTSELMDSLPKWEPFALANATLPHARMARVGTTVSVFATMANASETDLAGCGVALRGDLPLTMHFVQTDPSTNAITGEQDSYFALPVGTTQSLVLLFTPSTAFDSQPLDLLFDCGNTETGFGSAVARVTLGAKTAEVTDVLAVSGTASGDGLVRLDENLHGAFVVATQNLGAATGVADLSIQPDPGTVDQAVVCETDATTGNCLAPAQASLSNLEYLPGQTRTFAVFVAADSQQRFSFRQSRVEVQIRGENGEVVGSTSVAVER